jgi:glutathione S-transferase
MDNTTLPKSSTLGPPTLHHLNSSQSFRVLWALEELAGADDSFKYNLKNYKRQRGRAPLELQKIYPLGKSPILEILPVEGLNQERIVVTESRLILQFLADNYSNGIWDTQTPQDAQRNNYYQEFSNCSFAPKVDFVMIFDIIPSAGPWIVRPLASAVFSPIANMFKKDLVGPLELMESALSVEKPWFAGQNLGLADFCLTWPMDHASQRGYFEAVKYPKVAEWHKRVKERPAYKRALEKGGVYDMTKFS